MGFYVLESTSRADALDVARRQPDLSVICVDEMLAEGKVQACDLLQGFKNAAPDIPVVWADSTKSRLNLSRIRPDSRVSNPPNSATVHERTEATLRERLYPRALVDSFLNAVQTALREGFRMNPRAGKSYLRATTDMYGDVTALVTFQNARLRGRIVVSGDKDHLDVIWRRVFPRRSPSQRATELQDLVGEMANQILGPFKTTLERQSELIRVSPPMHALGIQTSLRFRERRPGLVIELNDLSHCLFVELAFDLDALRPPTAPQGGEAERIGNAGEIVFF
ncbi:MAG TPA: chemotaxis protein CheX [Polyangiaceae bacterium]|jgi:CheY-specific phosphatase CheX|nr:chemotaxis protein CheX [Polyangiaceae bacterium]